jgi:hypothetical protein
MKRTLLLLIPTLLIAACQQMFYYDMVSPSAVKGYHPDSLKWQYTNGAPSRIPVRDKNDELMWLSVNESTVLEVKTIEGEQFFFRLQSVVGDEQGDGLLGSNTAWRGHDVRAGVERSVYLREVGQVKIRSSTPATERILPNR